MKFLKVCLCVFLSLSFAARAEIPFEQMKGLHGKMKPGAEIFSPIYGFLAVNTDTLERIRFFGNYGKIYKTPLSQKPENLVDPLFPAHPEWIHPAFDVKTKKIKKGQTEIDDEHAFEKQFEYPLDEISSLIQWLFPSVDGVVFVANDRSEDPVGEISLHFDYLLDDRLRIEKERIFDENIGKVESEKQSIDSQISEIGTAIIQKSEDIKKIIQDETKDLSQEVRKGVFKKTKDGKDSEIFLKIKERQKLLEEEKKNLEREKLQLEITQKEVVHKIQEFQKEKENFRSILSLPVILKTIEEKPRSLKAFVGKIDPHLSNNQDKKYVFLEILYKALEKDGTFGASHDENYPKHIALHALLGYLWSIANTKEQIITVMEKAGLMELFRSKRDTHRLDTAQELDREKALLINPHYTQEDYDRLKQEMLQHRQGPINFEEAAFAGYGYEVYAQRFPEIVRMGRAAGNKDRKDDKEPIERYPDCGETALRKFFNIMFSKEGGKFDVSFISKEWIYHDKLQKFYTDFPSISLQKDQKARDAWSSIVSDLNKKDNPESSTDVQYVGRYTPSKKYSEIDSGEWGVGNILNVMGKLTGDLELGKAWDVYPGSSDFDVRKQKFYEQIALKLSHLCTLLSRGSDFKVAWSKDGGKRIDSAHGDFKFFLGRESFVFRVMPGHFQIHPPHQKMDDWRKGRSFSEDLLNSFYKQDPANLFLDPEISAKSDEDIISFWKNKTELSKVTFPLRLVYKLYGGQVEDRNDQIYIMSMIQELPKFDQTYHPLVKNFVQDFLVEKLGKKDPNRSKLFAFEFDLTKELILGDISYGALERMKCNKILEIIKENIEKEIKQESTQETKNIESIMGENSSAPILMPLIDSNKIGYNQKIKIAKWLLEHKIDVNAQNGYGTTALHFASRRGPFDIVKLLLEKGADVSIKNRYWETVVHFAALGGHLDIVKLLLEKGADVNIKNRDGETALHFVTKKGHLDIVKLLLEKGTDVNTKDGDGETALHSAAWNGHLDIVKLLLEKGADVNIKNEKGWTALHVAVLCNHLEIVRVLLDHGANIHISDQQVRKALSIAQENKNDKNKREKDREIAGEIEKLILEHKAKQEAATKIQRAWKARKKSSDMGVLSP